MSIDNEKIARIRHQLGLINYGLEKETWKDFIALFRGDKEKSITSFYESSRRGENHGSDESPTSEDDAAESIEQQDLTAEQFNQVVDDVHRKFADRKSQETSSMPETVVTLEEKVNAALNTFEEVVAAMEAGEPIVGEFISEIQRETLKKLTQLFPTSKPKKPKKISADQVKEDENLNAEGKNAEEENTAQPSLL